MLDESYKFAQLLQPRQRHFDSVQNNNVRLSYSQPFKFPKVTSEELLCKNYYYSEMYLTMYVRYFVGLRIQILVISLRRVLTVRKCNIVHRVT